MQWLQDPNKSNVDNMKIVRRETRRHLNFGFIVWDGSVSLHCWFYNMVTLLYDFLLLILVQSPTHVLCLILPVIIIIVIITIIIIIIIIIITITIISNVLQQCSWTLHHALWKE
jgi:hypothetical protein